MTNVLWLKLRGGAGGGGWRLEQGLGRKGFTPGACEVRWEETGSRCRTELGPFWRCGRVHSGDTVASLAGRTCPSCLAVAQVTRGLGPRGLTPLAEAHGGEAADTRRRGHVRHPAQTQKPAARPLTSPPIFALYAMPTMQ